MNWLAVYANRPQPARLHNVDSHGRYKRISVRTRGSSKPPRRLIGLALIGLCIFAGISVLPRAQGLGQSSSIEAALSWLVSHQLSDGSYGAFTEPQTAPAAYGLWIRYLDSPTVLSSFRWLKNQMQNSTTWFWGGGGNLAEADVPGEILYSFDQTQNLQMFTQLSTVTTSLLNFQQSNGGFQGYYDSSAGKQVTSSVDTATALLGLIGANSISSSGKTAATNYLVSLQNSDGSFNLTKTISSSSLYSLGPEPVSITALVVLALLAASFSPTDPHISSAVAYLTSAASASFNGHVYAAALSLLVFGSLSDKGEASIADHYLLLQQNSDGGFRDNIRSSTGSNALDTGWAVVALQLGGAACCTGSGGGRRYIV